MAGLISGFSPIFFLGTLLFLSCLSPTATARNGFTLEMKLRDGIPQSDIIAQRGHYLVKLKIGTPPTDVDLIYDTGSDLLWTQCLPCENCYKQKNPMFNPKTSSSYKDLSCQAKECSLVGTGTCSADNTCSYNMAYGSGGKTQGVMATDTIGLPSAGTLGTVSFGCGHTNAGSFNELEMGILGFGGSPLSLISQLGPSLGGRKFSQCLLPFQTDPNISSKLTIGRGSEVTGAGVATTPLVRKEDKNPYFVTMEGINVGAVFFPFSSSGNVQEGNMFLDSGTPPMLLPKVFLNRLTEEVKKQIPMTPIRGDPRLGTQLCYKSQGNIVAPVLTVQFKGNAKVQLTATQTFIRPFDGIYRFAVAEVPWEVGIYGGFAQSNFLIGIDIDGETVSFQATDCTKHQ